MKYVHSPSSSYSIQQYRKQHSVQCSIIPFHISFPYSLNHLQLNRSVKSDSTVQYVKGNIEKTPAKKINLC